MLTSALAAALLAVVYFAWFRREESSVKGALFWAAAGILCTPNWYYGTSTFDDILGTGAVVAAIVVASYGRTSRRLAPVVWSGLLVGLAFNCKQPLAAFGLMVVAAGDIPDDARRKRIARAAVVLLGLLAGIAVYLAYELYKFPVGTHFPKALLDRYQPLWPGHPAMALLALALSPAAGVLWYSPTVLLGLRGLRDAAKRERQLVAALGVATVIFVGFIASLSFFKGDTAWGPRYLTPLLGVLWLGAARGHHLSRRTSGAILLALGFLVQIAGLAVVPGRLYVERRGIPEVFGGVAPILYFDPANAHLIQRPREIAEIWAARTQTTPFSPFSDPTAAGFFTAEPGPAAIGRWKALNSFRPWWASQIYLPPQRRPVSIVHAVLVFTAMGIAGAVMIVLGMRRSAAPLAARCRDDVPVLGSTMVER